LIFYHIVACITHYLLVIIEQIKSIGFKRPDGKKVLVALNTGKETVFTIDFDQKKYNFMLPEKSASTIVW
jgi:O-glycosyl hydrolase